MTKNYRVRISGRVQGVCFRYFTEQEANRLGITGWVRNRRDGSVEALICGDEIQSKMMLELLHHGPPSASVTSVDIEEFPGDSDYDSFSIRY